MNHAAKTLTIEVEISDEQYQKLSEMKLFEAGFFVDVVKDIISIFMNDTRGYFFTDSGVGRGIAILSKEWVDEILKREYHIDENAVRERNALQKKIDAIKEILK